MPMSVVFPVLLLAAAENDLSAAQKAWADVDYGRCRDKAGAALLLPASRSERVDTYRLLGLCSAAEGDTDAARDAFQVMLALDHDARLPEGLSPRFTSSFREAKGAWVDVVPLSLTIASEQTGAAGRLVRVRVQDAADVVDKLAWRSEGGVLSRPVKRADVVELTVPADAVVTIVALDVHGGEVALLELARHRTDDPDPLGDLEPSPSSPAAPTVKEAESFPWWAVGGVAGAVVVLGVGVGVGAAVLSSPPQVTLVPRVVFAE